MCGNLRGVHLCKGTLYDVHAGTKSPKDAFLRTITIVKQGMAAVSKENIEVKVAMKGFLMAIVLT